jgi:hypothetical protein
MTASASRRPSASVVATSTPGQSPNSATHAAGLRESDEPYRATYGTVSLDRIANTERSLPDEFIGADGRSVTPAFRRYALPLLGDPLPAYGRIDPVPFTRDDA